MAVTPINDGDSGLDARTKINDNDLELDSLKAPKDNPTFTGQVRTPEILISSETASRLAIIDSAKLVKSADTATYPSLTELAFVKGLSSAVQTQLNAKQATITGGATTIATSDLTVDRALISSGTGKVAVSSTTAAQLAFLNTVSSNVQTQLDAKAALASPTFTGTPAAPTAANGTNTTQLATTQFVQTAIGLLTVASGTYTPSLRNTTNIAASTARLATYMRVGNTVTVAGQIDIDVTTGAATASLIGISIPIASNFSTVYQAGGVASLTSSSTGVVSGGIFADTTNDEVSLSFDAVDTTNQPWCYTFTYQVI